MRVSTFRGLAPLMALLLLTVPSAVLAAGKKKKDAAAPAAAPAINFMKPLTPDAEKSSLDFFNLLNFVLQSCPTVPSAMINRIANPQKSGASSGETVSGNASRSLQWSSPSRSVATKYASDSVP